MTPAAALLHRIFSTALTSPARRGVKRSIARISRTLRGAPGRVHYFHQADDPYSHLAAQCLAPLGARYRIDLVAHLVPPPDDAAAPERTLLKAFARRDAVRLARRHGLWFQERAEDNSPASVAEANAALARSIAGGTFGSDVVAIGKRFWQGESQSAAGAAGDGARERALREGGDLRARFGHYLGGMFHFEGEWYWGVDRLHHLERRLQAEGLSCSPRLPPVAPFQDMTLDGSAKPGKKPVIEFWFSFRSPYSYIAAPRLHRLAAHYGAQVRWRFILPMIMRGLPVPRPKSRYIMLDVKREAEVLGLPFGTAVDPFGKGIERGIAVLHHAIRKGRGAAFTESGLQAIFADGIDLASNRGLLRAANRAGLSGEEVGTALSDDSWRPVAEENRKALFAAGLWGAPTYRVDGMPAHWGQDRLWALEEDMKTVLAQN